MLTRAFTTNVHQKSLAGIVRVFGISCIAAAISIIPAACSREAVFGGQVMHDLPHVSSLPRVDLDRPSQPLNPVPPAAAPPLSAAQQIDQDVKRLLTRDARWQAPDSLRVDETANVALTIGDVKSLQGQLTNFIPSVALRPPVPVTIGSTIKVRLTADAADASVDPVEAINNSIGEQTSVLFGWQVHPRRSGDLLLVAHIEFPLANTVMREQMVTLRIHVQNTPKHVFLSIVENFWTQVVAVTGVIGTALRWAWKRYNRGDQADSTPNEKGSAPSVSQSTDQGQSDNAKPAARDGEPAKRTRSRPLLRSGQLRRRPSADPRHKS